MNENNINLIQKQLEYYNSQNIDEFIDCFSFNVTTSSLNGNIIDNNRDELKIRYMKLFHDYPNNNAILVNRIAVGNSVIDHEIVNRVKEEKGFEIIAIYTIENNLISRCDFIK